MSQNRFSAQMLPDTEQAPTLSSAFFLLAVPQQETPSGSLMVSCYQQLYQRAVQAQQKPATKCDLFAVMN